MPPDAAIKNLSDNYRVVNITPKYRGLAFAKATQLTLFLFFLKKKETLDADNW